ncbi:MAG: Aminoglycoside phosphotransferase [Candidatus Magasanikbacteria bacterium GW2011_GWC2_37_14]|uniref:Aminoglycoside phosphotransferase n=1 Tax=Candidatus Magasanikbacteria bacterium GW2011_GWC2_37_14 TaxID=1619046 RepID=A0A0G0JJ84_9BACT|nr:MAG: Aminoglycoside phosphotransferase [Candidatus Magasanikbacteria bacterium GW2011_GWC2_37_14]
MTEQNLIKKIQQEFPQIKWKKYRYLTHGWDHDVIIFDGKLVFRIPKEKAKDLQSQLFNETQILKYLKNKLLVGLPDYQFIAKDKTFAGYPLLLGQELSPAKFKHLTIKEKHEFTKQLANFLTILHQTSKNIVNKYQVRTVNDQKNYTRLIANTEKFVFPKLKENEIKQIRNYLVEFKNSFKHSNVFIHNDLCWEHILWDKKEQKINIIDFSDQAWADPAGDFTGLWEYGDDFVKKVYKLYGGKKDNKFLYRSKLYYQQTPLFIMKDALCGCPCTFEQGYKMFKKRFKNLTIK